MPLDLNNIKDQAVGLKDQASSYLQSDDFKKILPYILSGGAGAAIGGAMTGRRRRSSGEGRMGHLRRILTNAIVGGGLAGGAHLLVNKGLESATGAAAGEPLLANEKKVNSPLESATKSIAFSPLTAVGAGATALAATDGNSLIGADRAGQSRAARVLAGKLGIGVDELGELPAKNVSKLNLSGDVDKLRQRAGVASGEGIKGLLSSITRKGPLSTLGQTWPRRSVRGGIGLAAASLPALLGAFVTSPDSK